MWFRFSQKCGTSLKNLMVLSINLDQNCVPHKHICKTILFIRQTTTLLNGWWCPLWIEAFIYFSTELMWIVFYSYFWQFVNLWLTLNMNLNIFYINRIVLVSIWLFLKNFIKKKKYLTSKNYNKLNRSLTFRRRCICMHIFVKQQTVLTIYTYILVHIYKIFKNALVIF